MVKSSDRGHIIRNEVTEEHIAEVVSKWTNIPVAKLLGGERDRLMKMEDHIRRRVIGQDEAVSAICNAVRRNRAGLGDPNRPIGTFLFLGPTGVGKTELSKGAGRISFQRSQLNGQNRYERVYGAAFSGQAYQEHPRDMLAMKKEGV